MKTPVKTFRIPVELREQAEAEAKKGNLSLSQWVFKAMRYYIHALKYFQS